jgi:signal transduction histidine kinase
MGQTPRLLRSRHQDDEFYRNMWRTILDPERGYWKGELVNLSKDGREVPVLLSITPFRDDSGKLTGYMGIAIDLTDKKELEAEVLQQDRLASIGFLASGLAHEIGTPLGVIRGRAEYLGMRQDASQPIREGLEIITAQIDRISKLIYSLLHLARAEKSGTPHPVQLSRVAEDVMNLMSHPFKKEQIELEINLPPEAKALVEPDRLGQVLINLVVNALHAVQSAKAAGRPGPHKVAVGLRERAREWEISVSDTGTGMTEETKKHLFKPFFTTKEVGKGTGLGLSISHRIISSWGGSIQVDSAWGKGTTFRILLPKA